jgi:carbonic anhydrase/acetyltransferase-like protein (isoleucine patch superfamily)
MFVLFDGTGVVIDMDSFTSQSRRQLTLQIGGVERESTAIEVVDERLPAGAVEQQQQQKNKQTNKQTKQTNKQTKNINQKTSTKTKQPNSIRQTFANKKRQTTTAIDL